MCVYVVGGGSVGVMGVTVSLILKSSVCVFVVGGGYGGSRYIWA